MRRFAAQLSFRFQEVPFLDRFEAAAKRGMVTILRDAFFWRGLLLGRALQRQVRLSAVAAPGHRLDDGRAASPSVMMKAASACISSCVR